MTREELIEEFQETEASLELSGFSPSKNGLYQLLKTKIINGEITIDQAREEFIERFDAYYQLEGL